MNLTLKETIPGQEYEVYFRWNLSDFRHIYIGRFYKEVDGFYVYAAPEAGNVFWTQDFLFTLAMKLIELNKPWQDQIDKDLKDSFVESAHALPEQMNLFSDSPAPTSEQPQDPESV